MPDARYRQGGAAGLHRAHSIGEEVLQFEKNADGEAKKRPATPEMVLNRLSTTAGRYTRLTLLS